MKKILALSTLLISLTSFAESAKLTIEGMHCGGCKKMVTKKVCEDAAMKPTFETCAVTSLDTKKQIGILEITFKKDAHADLAALEKAITTAGEDYKLTNKEITK